MTPKNDGGHTRTWIEALLRLAKGLIAETEK